MGNGGAVVLPPPPFVLRAGRWIEVTDGKDVWYYNKVGGLVVGGWGREEFWGVGVGCG